MKKGLLFVFLLTAIFNSKDTFSQQIEKGDSLGLPGDNLNLYAVLDLFQNSATFEEFEKKLNLEDSKINNLDLNNDDKTDYIKVIDHQTGESHAVVLQVPVNEKETQDVAVIEIEKDKNGKVIVQIVGNEELYGKDYIVEPAENDPTAKKADPNKKSDTTVSDGKTVINNTTNNYITTDNWPIVHHVYAPSYVVYVSPWYWYYYPSWWSPWTPWYWHSYYWHHRHHHHHYHPYYGYYRHTDYYRAPGAHRYYGPRRSVSTTVQNNRASKVYIKTYQSKDRKGDGKIKPAVVNPAYKGDKDSPKGNRADSPKGNKSDVPKGNRVDPPKSKGDNGNYDKPRSKKNKPSVKPENKPKSGGRATPRPRGNNKPASKPRGGSGTKKGGGTGGR